MPCSENATFTLNNTHTGYWFFDAPQTQLGHDTPNHHSPNPHVRFPNVNWIPLEAIAFYHFGCLCKIFPRSAKSITSDRHFAVPTGKTGSGSNQPLVSVLPIVPRDRWPCNAFERSSRSCVHPSLPNAFTCSRCWGYYLVPVVRLQFLQPLTLNQRARFRCYLTSSTTQKTKKSKVSGKGWLRNNKMNNNAELCKNTTDYGIESYYLLSPIVAWRNLADPSTRQSNHDYTSQSSVKY